MGRIRSRKETGRLYLDFVYQGQRCREYTALVDNRPNRRRLEKVLLNIEAEITLGTFNYTETFPGSASAKRLSAIVESRGECSKNGEPEHPRINQFAETWFTENEPNWKNSYREKLHDIYEKHLRQGIGEKVVSGIQKSEVLAFRAELAKANRETGKQLSASRINQIVNLLKQIVNEAADRFEFTTPFLAIKPIKVPKTVIDPFSLGEIQRFLVTVPSDWHPYYVVRFFSGMRTSEIDGLKWEYIDFERQEILIRKVLVRGQMETPKTEGSIRTIQMSSMVYEAFKNQRNIIANRPKAQQSKFVFPSKLGFPLQYHNVSNRIWYPTLKKAGLKTRNPYQTRHTAATIWLAAGESPEWIAAQMGHANTKMLFTTYSRFVPNLTRQDGSAMDQLLRAHLSPCGNPPREEAPHA